MRKCSPLLTHFAEALGLQRSRLFLGLQYKIHLCLCEKVLPQQTGSSKVKKQDPGLPGNFFA